VTNLKTKRELQDENEVLRETLREIYDVVHDDESEDPLQEISDLAADALGFEATEAVEQS